MLESGVNSAATTNLEILLEGNERFRNGRNVHYQYSPEKISQLAVGQAPLAAVVACSDGRVTPEIVFDQPLAKLFVSRVPGNVASDSAKWMLEIAVTNLHVPLVIVLGHTECLAIKQVLNGESGAGGSLRMDVARAVRRAQSRPSDDVYRDAVRENAIQTTTTLLNESGAVRSAVRNGNLELMAGVYDVHTGQVELLNPR